MRGADPLLLDYLALEQAVFAEVRDYIGTRLEEIQRTAVAISELDALCRTAEGAGYPGGGKAQDTLALVKQLLCNRHSISPQNSIL